MGIFTSTSKNPKSGTFPNKQSSLRVRLIAGWFTLSHGVLCVWNGTRLPSSRTPTLSFFLTSPSSRNRRGPLFLAPFLHLAPPSLDSPLPFVLFLRVPICRSCPVRGARVVYREARRPIATLHRKVPPLTFPSPLPL